MSLSYTLLTSAAFTEEIKATPHVALETEETEAQLATDFLRNVMQPIGAPFVSFFHSMRESLFLNTTVVHPHPFEAVGDFFLTPSRYLFAGKKIVETQQQDYTLVQAHNYRHKYGLKVLGSLIALPVSYTVGALFKGIAYLKPEVRRRHRQIKGMLATLHVESHLDAYQKKGIAAFYSEEFIPCQEHKRPSRLNRKQVIEIEAMKAVTALLDAHGILYWIDCGTCLGAYRYGGIIPWDWDIDLAIVIDDHDNVKSILSTLDKSKYQIQDWSSYSHPKSFLKLYVKETKNFIDIYHYKINEEEQTVQYFFTYADSPFPHSWKVSELKCTKPLRYEEVFPLKQAHFDGLTVRAPHSVVPFLQSKYGSNLDPTMLWDEQTKTYAKVENHPFYK